MEDRTTLPEELKNAILHYRDRRTVGVITTEHVIFIPTELMKNSEEETDLFIDITSEIKFNEHWNCKVEYTKVTEANVPGLEFVFSFTPETEFDKIIEFIEDKLN
jgi:hypothetical protein